MCILAPRGVTVMDGRKMLHTALGYVIRAVREIGEQLDELRQVLYLYAGFGFDKIVFYCKLRRLGKSLNISRRMQTQKM